MSARAFVRILMVGVAGAVALVGAACEPVKKTHP
jgi:hypothetical protein